MEGALKVGDVVHLDGEAGILFRFRPLIVRVTGVVDGLPGRTGLWITGYELDPGSHVVVDRRELYIQNVAGVTHLDSVSSVGPAAGKRRTVGAPAG